MIHLGFWGTVFVLIWFFGRNTTTPTSASESESDRHYYDVPVDE